jgi:hypothetical protein
MKLSKRKNGGRREGGLAVNFNVKWHLEQRRRLMM